MKSIESILELQLEQQVQILLDKNRPIQDRRAAKNKIEEFSNYLYTHEGLLEAAELSEETLVNIINICDEGLKKLKEWPRI